MKTKRFISIIMAVFSIFFMAFFSGCEENNEKKTIYIVAKGKDSSFWQSVKKGADVASVEYNVKVVFLAPKTEEDGKAQIELIEQAIKNQAHAIMLSAIDYEESAEYVDKAVSLGIPVVAFDSATKSEKPLVNITINDKTAGGSAFKELRKQVEGQMKIGIVNFHATTDNGQKREQGFREEAKKDGNNIIVDAINVDSNVESASTHTKNMIKNHPEINAIVTFNEWTTLGVGKAVLESENKNKIAVVGFDNNIKSVSHMEMGIIDGLIVQNPYAMGYLGIENACNIINGKIRKRTELVVETVTANRKNMFDKDIANLLFPFKG